PAAGEGGRAHGLALVGRPPGASDAQAGARTLLAAIGAARRGVVVAGRHERPTPLAEASAELCVTLGWPLLADPLSGARRGAAAVAHYDALLRDPAFSREHAPEVVLRVGDLPVSKPLRAWLASLTGARQITLDPEGAWQDPASVVSDSIAAEPAETLGVLARLIASKSSLPATSQEIDARGATGEADRSELPLMDSARRDPDWLESWRSADERAAESILGVLGTRASEPAVAAELGVLLPQAATLFVASSMPVRDIETFWPVRPDPPRVLCNRGANGIDGTVSSAFGAAAASRGPVVLLIGDVALAYDIGGLLAAKRLELELTIVLLNNEGGGIFDFLPVATAAIARNSAPGTVHDTAGGDTAAQDIYTRHIATPTGLDFAHAAALYGLSHESVTDVAGFRAALERAIAAPGSAIVEVRGERSANVELHRRVWSAVESALNS
ncbi:MAG TPA: thiamine pyrophosphate-dependent enzyme, partial [Solirubrobacteraceae bacterium]|nr:thiamine pyrophosphate-dependent enzyme [Solirubrobacteraceae bacterium]